MLLFLANEIFFSFEMNLLWENTLLFLRKSRLFCPVEQPVFPLREENLFLFHAYKQKNFLLFNTISCRQSLLMWERWKELDQQVSGQRLGRILLVELVPASQMHESFFFPSESEWESKERALASGEIHKYFSEFGSRDGSSKTAPWKMESLRNRQLVLCPLAWNLPSRDIKLGSCKSQETPTKSDAWRTQLLLCSACIFLVWEHMWDWMKSLIPSRLRRHILCFLAPKHTNGLGARMENELSPFPDYFHRHSYLTFLL